MNNLSDLRDKVKNAKLKRLNFEVDRVQHKPQNSLVDARKAEAEQLRQKLKQMVDDGGNIQEEVVLQQTIRGIEHAIDSHRYSRKRMLNRTTTY